MCGIAGIYLRDPAFEVDLDGMTKSLTDEIDHRGKHACGVVAIGDDGVGLWQKAAVSATKFNLHRKPIPSDSRGVLIHTRWATQGDPGFMENNHPIKRGAFFIIHNGHVSNDWELFRNAERNRFGKVDSEAIAARLSSFGDLGDLDKVMAEIRGGAAVAAMDERDASRLAIAKGASSPLHVYCGDRIIIFASTISAIRNAYTKHIGTFSEERLHELHEGDAWEWRDQVIIKRTFEVKERYYAWRSGPGHAGGWVPGAHIITSSTLNKAADVTKKSKKERRKERKERRAALNGARKPWVVSPRQGIVSADDEHISCEHCGVDVHWADINYFRPEGVTFLVCEECFEELTVSFEDEEETLRHVLDSNDYGDRGTLFEDEESEVVDDFEAANRGILRNFLNW